MSVATEPRIASRPDSSATLARTTGGATSAGTDSMRSICSIAFRTGTEGGPAVGDPLVQGADVLLDERGKAA